MSTLRLLTDHDEPLAPAALAAALDELREGFPHLADKADAELLDMPAAELAELLRQRGERLRSEGEAGRVGSDLLSALHRTMPGASVDIDRPGDPLYDRLIGLPVTVQTTGLLRFLSMPGGRDLFDAMASAMAELADETRARIIAVVDDHDEGHVDGDSAYCPTEHCGWVLRRDDGGLLVGLAGEWLLRVVEPDAGDAA